MKFKVDENMPIEVALDMMLRQCQIKNWVADPTLT
jgi:hypothetical protein